MIFGRRKPPPPPPGGGEPPALPPAGEQRPFPWAADREYFAACNFAYGDFLNNFEARMAIDGRVHAETHLAAAGLIAGFAAQRGMFARAGWPPGMMTATAENGRIFYFGDPLNAELLASGEQDAYDKAGSLVLGAVVAGGGTPPEIGPMFAHVSRMIGEDFYPSTAERPQVPGLELLRLVWPFALLCFGGTLSGKVLGEKGVVPQRWRPVVAAQALHVCLRRTQGVLAPAIGGVIAMESAIYGSKVDPTLIETA